MTSALQQLANAEDVVSTHLPFKKVWWRMCGMAA